MLLPLLLSNQSRYWFLLIEIIITVLFLFVVVVISNRFVFFSAFLLLRFNEFSRFIPYFKSYRHFHLSRYLEGVCMFGFVNPIISIRRDVHASIPFPFQLNNALVRRQFFFSTHLWCVCVLVFFISNAKITHIQFRSIRLS